VSFNQRAILISLASCQPPAAVRFLSDLSGKLSSVGIMIRRVIRGRILRFTVCRVFHIADRENVYMVALIDYDGELNVQDTNRLTYIISDFYMHVLGWSDGGRGGYRRH
jgi:hypothetical protein